MGINTGSYSYNISANADNSAYLWSGHGLTDVPNPTLYFRDGDIVTISKIGGGHPLKVINDVDETFVLESGGVLLLEPIEEGSYTYVCTSHAAMTGKILVGARYQGEGPDEGFGTGLLPTRNSSISVNQIRTKINEIITKGGVGGGKVTVSDSPPDFPSEGNLWYDSSFAALFAYLEDYGWVQTNGAVGRAQAVIVNSSEPSGAQENDFWFDTINNVLKIYISGVWYAAAQTNQDSSSEEGNSGSSVSVSQVQPEGAIDGDLWFNPNNQSLSIFSSSSWLPLNSKVLATNLTPTDTNQGDLWLNTDNNILSIRGDEAWIAINRNQVDIYDSNNRPTDALNGDLFFNTDSEIIEVYNNGKWILSGITSSAFSQLSENFDTLSKELDALSGSGANVTANTEAPADPAGGDLWFNQNVGSLFVYIDGTGWVETNPGGSGGSDGSDGASVITDTVPSSNPSDGDLWFNENEGELYVYTASLDAWIQANGGGGSGGEGGGSSGGGGGSQLVSISRVDLSSITNQDTTFNATDHGVPAGATHIQGYALVISSTGGATISVNAGTQYDEANAFSIVYGNGVGEALIPLDEDGNFNVRRVSQGSGSIVVGFSIIGYMSSSSGGGGGSDSGSRYFFGYFYTRTIQPSNTDGGTTWATYAIGTEVDPSKTYRLVDIENLYNAGTPASGSNQPNTPFHGKQIGAIIPTVDSGFVPSHYSHVAWIDTQKIYAFIKNNATGSVYGEDTVLLGTSQNPSQRTSTQVSNKSILYILIEDGPIYASADIIARLEELT